MDENAWLVSTDAERMVERLGNDPRHDEALIRFAITCIQHHPPLDPASPEPARGPGNGFLLARWATRNALPAEGPAREEARAWQAALLRGMASLFPHA